MQGGWTRLRCLEWRHEYHPESCRSPCLECARPEPAAVGLLGGIGFRTGRIVHYTVLLMKNSSQELKTEAKPLHTSQQNGLRLDEERVAQLLDIAAEEFLENGFAAASLSRIARKSKASKTTFYSRFPHKEQLFLAVMERLMRSYTIEVESFLHSDLALEDSLKKHARSLLKPILSDRQVSLNRIAIMEGQRFPTFAKQFFELGPRRGQTLMADYFKKKIAAGELVDEDPWMMSEHYLSLLFGGPVRWSVLQLRSAELKPGELTKHIEGVVTVFLRAYQISAPARRMKG